MNTAMRWSVLLIMMIYALGSCKAQDSTSSARCRLPSNATVGQQIRIQFLLSSDPKIDKKDVHISKVADGTSICEPRNKKEFILETKFNVTTEDMDSHTREGYIYGGIDKERLLTIFIKKVGPQHEGFYVVEESKDLYGCYLKVLDDAHREDCQDWKREVLGLIKAINIPAIVLVLVIVLVQVIVFGAYWIKQKRTAASKKKTDQEETNDNNRSRQEETSDGWNTSGKPSADNILQLRGLRKQRADQQSSGSYDVEMATDDESSDHRTGDHSTKGQRNAASSFIPLLEKQDVNERLQGPGKATSQVETQDKDFDVRGYHHF